MKFDNTKDFLSFIKKSLGDGDFDSQIKRFAEGLRVKGKFENMDLVPQGEERRWVSSSYPNESFYEYGNYKNWDWMKYGKTYLVTNGSDVPTITHNKRIKDIKSFLKRGGDGTMPSFFFIYYGNQEDSVMWVALDSLAKGIWNMDSQGGECWVTDYIELKLENNSFLNWDKIPWSDLK